MDKVNEEKKTRTSTQIRHEKEKQCSQVRQSHMYVPRERREALRAKSRRKTMRSARKRRSETKRDETVDRAGHAQRSMKCKHKLQR